MKNNFLSLMGMRLKGRRMNDPEITRKSPGNHPVITPFSRLITSTLLLLFTFAIGNVWAVDYSPLNYNGEASIPSGYKCYGSSAGATCTPAKPSSFNVGEGSASVVCFDVTDNGSGGGGGTYNKRAKEFVITEDCSVEVELYTGNTNRVFNLYNNSSTVVASKTLESKNTKYIFNYTFTGATALSPKTYSFSGSGSKVYISKITFTPAAPCTETAPTSVTVSGGATYDKGDALSNLSAAVTGGTGTMSYQWYCNTTNAATVDKEHKIDDATSATLAPYNKVGTRYYYCVASNCAGSVTSNTTAVTINANCSVTGDIFTLTMNTENAPTSEVKTPVNLTMNIDTYINIDGGDIVLVTGSSQHSSITTTPRIKLGGSSGYAQITLDCPLQEGDKITFEKTNKIALAVDASGTNKIQLASGTKEYTITKEDCLYNQSNLFILRDGNNVEISSITITRPAPAKTYNATFANGGHGTAPAAATGVSSVTLTKLTESGWTNIGWKADKATKVGTTDKAAGATLNIGDEVTLLENTTFTAQWEAEKQTPKVTFNDGAYVVGASALDLSSLFSSQNESAVSFALKEASDDATVSGKNFTATKEGSYVVVATQDADATYKAVSKEATMVVTYPATGAATIIYNVAVGTSQATLATASKEDNSASISNLVGFTAVDIATRTGNGKTGSSPKLETPATKVQGKYIYVTFDVADGKEFVLDSVVTKMVAVTSSKTIEIVISDTEGTKDSLNYEQGTNNDPGAAHQFNFTSSAKAYQGTVTVKIYAYGATDDYRIGKPLKVCGTVKAATPKFAVSFAKGGADGSETMSPVNYEVGAQVTAPDCDFTYTDHIFREWAVTGVAGVTSVAAGGKFNMPNNEVTLTAQWLANNYEAKIGTTFYATLAEALLYAADGEIELLKNVDVTSQVEIAAGVTATIDLAGYKIEYTGTETLPSGVILVHNGASLTINDSSDPDAGSVVAGAKAYAAVALTKLGDDASQAANLTINGGTFTGLYYAITGNGARHNTNTTINGGTFTATATNDNLAIFHPQNGTLTINGGTFTGYASAIEMRAGTLVINDGTFTATATTYSCNQSGSGSTTVGAAIAIAQHTTKKDISVTINGGTFNGVKALNEANPQGNPDPAITMSVTAGTFTGEVSTVDVNKFISGGTFDAPVAVANCAENYAPKNNGDGTYGVKPLAQTFSLEDLVTSEGKSADYTEYLNGLGWTVSNANALDGIDTDKPYDNYPYLGLKFKNNTGYVAGSVEGGKLLTIKLGHMAGVAHLIVDDVKKAELNGKDAADPAVHYYYVENAANVKVLFANAGSSATCVLKAIAVTDPYEVSFDVNGGDEIAAQYFYGTALTLPGATKGTESFLGWFDGETKVGEAGDKYTPTANITLKAHWEAISTDARLASITFSSNAGTLSPAFDPEVTNYTYTMPYGTAAVPTITGATKANPAAKAPVIDAQATAWGETAHVHGVAQSGATKDYYVQMLRAPKDGICIIKSTPTSGTEADVDGIYQGSAYFKGKAANKKLNSTYDYVAVELADGYTFQAGDKVVLNQAADLGDASDITKFYVFTEVPADGKTYVTVDNAAPVKGDNWFDMPADLVGASALYIGRVDSKCNPTVGYLAVYRPLPPVLNKVTVAGVEGKPNALKQIEIEVPFSTSQSQLEAIAFDWVSNDDAWTASHTGVAANAWEFGVANTVTLTDKDGDESVYTIMVNKATASTSVELATLSIDGNAITLVPGRAVYSYEYPYGTAETPAPVVAATAADNAEVGTITQAASKNGTATFTVTAEDGTTYRDYTINISVSRIPAVVIYDGSTMTDIATKTGSDPSSRFSWSMGSNVASTGDDIAGTWQGKNYTHAVKGFKANANANNLVSFVVPEDYMAKVRLVGSTNSSGSERKMFIAKEATNDASKAIENYVITSSTYDAQGFVTDFMLPGTYYLGSTDSYRLFEFSVQLYPIDYTRDVTEGRYGTICLPNGGIMVGAELYEVAYYDGTYEKIFLDEVLNGEMVAGRPYIFLTKEGVNQIAVYYTDEENASEGNYHGLFGSYTKINLAANGHIYILKDNRYYFVDTNNVYCGENRAYFKMGVDGGISGSYVAPAPGRRRTSIGAGAPAVATGVEDVQGDNVQCTKVLINGELFIIRGEKMYDAKGQLVK